MKKTLGIIGFILLFIFVVGGRLYKRYNRQQANEKQLKEQRIRAIEAKKAYDIREQKRLDSIKKSKPTRMDSVRAEIDEKRKKMQEIMKRLEKEAKDKKE